MVSHVVRTSFCIVTSRHCVEVESSWLGLSRHDVSGGSLVAQTAVLAEQEASVNMVSSNMMKQLGNVPDRICSTSETSLVGLGQQSSHSSPNLPGFDLLSPVCPSKALHLGLQVMSAASK